jgi:hypothetical protein
MEIAYSHFNFFHNEEMKLRIPEPAAAKLSVPKRERVCTQCGIDTVDLHRLSKKEI